MKSFFSTEGLAQRSARHPWRVIIAWVVIFVLAGVASTFMNTTTEADFTNQPESVKGTDLIQERLDTQEEFSETVIVRSDSLTVDDPAFRERVEQITNELTGMPEVVSSAFNYYQAVEASLPNAEAFVSPLIGMDNVILTPHVGGSTLEAQDNIGIEVASKLVRYSDNGSTLSAVNFPEASLPEHPHSRRLLHIHKNVPGMLSRINDLFSRENVNIDGQYLQTDPQVGYVVIDVSMPEERAAELKDALAAIPGTLRARVLY